MNKSDTRRIACYANDILWMWNDIIKDAESIEEEAKRSWYKHDVRQAYQDALNFLKRHGFIEAYDVVGIRVKINGEWRSDRLTLSFVPPGKGES